MCQWLAQFVITKSTPSIFLAMGWGTFIFFAAICALTAVFTFFFVPETKGLTMEEIDAKFGYHSHVRPMQRSMDTSPHGETASQEAKEKDMYRETV
jgi:hypothetical protein